MNSDGIYTGTGHLTPERIREYMGGKLSKEKMHEIEMHLLECDFCADALDGFELSEKSHIKTERSLLALRKSLNERVKQHGKPDIIRWPAWSAAAGIALAIAGYVVIMQREREQKQLAVQQSEAFLQTGSNDTLLIFMPAEQELIASNGPLSSDLKGSGPAEKEPGLRSGKSAVRTAAARQSNIDSAGNAANELKALQHRPEPFRPGVLDRETTMAKVGIQAPQKKNGEIRIRGISPGARVISGAGKQNTGMEKKKLVTGRVIAGNDQPLPGVTVAVEGTTLGTATDTNGNFKLEVPENKNTLVATLIGYKSKTVSLDDTLSGLLLAMQPDEQALEEVVVVGYGTQRRSGVVGAASQVRNQAALNAAPENGMEAYRKYLTDSLRYPKEALLKQIEGEVEVSFTVRPGGSLANFKILRSLGYGCDKEAIRLIREGPGWTSTVVKGGRKRAAEVTQTVKFKLPVEP